MRMEIVISIGHSTLDYGEGPGDDAMQADIAEAVDRVRQQARAVLEGLRRSTSEEIHNYPSPIAGCDQQFNHLLEQRTGIAAELQRLARIGAERAQAAEYARELDDFLGSCAYLDERTRQALRAGLRSAAGAPAVMERLSDR